MTEPTKIKDQHWLAAWASDIWHVVSSPKALKDKWVESAKFRKDRALEARLNKQIRSHFIEAFNKSAQGEMKVNDIRAMAQYKQRNTGFKAALLDSYEKFSFWNLPGKIATTIGFFKAASYGLAPVMGAWAIIVPLTSFIGLRMANVHRNTANEKQEKALAARGFAPPFRVSVKDQQVFLGQDNVTNDLKSAFAIQGTDTPEWIYADYNPQKSAFNKSRRIHGPEFEALRAGIEADAHDAIYKSLGKNPDALDTAFAFHVLFPNDSTAQIIDNVSATNTPLKDIASILNQFTAKNHSDKGLSSLSQKFERQNLDFLVQMTQLGHEFGRPQASLVKTQLSDARFRNHLNFTEIASISYWPEDMAASFTELWRDRLYRETFSFAQCKDILTHMDAWGRTALQITEKDYARHLKGAEIIELAQPENAYWAKAYHELRQNHPEQTAALSHDDCKALVQQYGLLAIQQLNARPQPV